MIFLAAAHAYGGPPWAVVGAVAVVVQSLVGLRLDRLALLLPAAAWLALFYATGNRELFFPYCLALAAFACLSMAGRGRWRAAGVGGLVVATFLGIRALQGAGGSVLAVESAVAAVILAGVVVAARVSHGRLAREAAIVAVASLLAYVGLAL